MLFQHCNFAHAGTWGHECGDVAKWAAPTHSERRENGIYWVRRCDKCRDIKGGENSGLIGPFVPFDHNIHSA